MSSPAPVDPAEPAASDSSGLRKHCLSFPEVLGQSVANVAPTASPTLNIPLVFASAANGTWLAYLLATIGMLLVGQSIGVFARRSASAGSLYGYVETGLGRTMGFVAGWCLALGYLLIVAASLCAFAEYGQELVGLVAPHFPTLGLYLICAFVAWLFAYRDIQVSTVTMLILEFLSVSTVIVLAVLFLLKTGRLVDPPQLALSGVTSKGLFPGLVIGVLSFVGFESAAALGNEAKNPLRTIPRAILSSTLISGLFFIAVAYIEVMAFRGQDTGLDKDTAPLVTVAELAGVPFFGLLMSICAVISFFACGLASINAGARIAYALGREGVLHQALGETHARNETPSVAVTMFAVVAVLLVGAMDLFHLKPLEIYGYVGTLGTYGFVVVYGLLALAAPVYLHRRGELRAGDAVLGLVGALFMAGIFAGNVYPPPAPPFNRFPYLFLMLVVVGVAWFWMLRMHGTREGSAFGVQERTTDH